MERRHHFAGYDSDGVIDSIQTDVKVDNADGSNSLTVTNIRAERAPRLTDRDDHKRRPRDRRDRSRFDRRWILRPDRGRRQGWRGEFDRHSPRLQSDGSLKDQRVTSTTASGLSKTTRIDSTGDGVDDQIQVDLTVVGADGSRPRRCSTSIRRLAAATGSWTQTSANGQTKTIQADDTEAASSMRP